MAAPTDTPIAKDISISIPSIPHTSIHIRVNKLATSTLIFLTGAEPETAARTSALGSFVYAMPNRLDPSDPLATPLISVPSSIDITTRIAKIIARRTKLPTYVGCSVLFGGNTVDEELEALQIIVKSVISEIEGLANPSSKGS